MADISLTESSEVTVASSDGINKLVVNSDGSINSTTQTNNVYTSAFLGALNAAVTAVVQGRESVGLQLQTGGLTATITPEVSLDSGLTWTATKFIDVVGGVTSSLTVTSPNPAVSRVIILPGGATHARARVSSYTSGSAAADCYTVTQNPQQLLLTSGPTAAAAPPNAILVGGSDGTTLKPLRLTTNGSGTIAALNQSVVVNTEGMGTVDVAISGTWSATLSFQGSVDGGTTYNNIIVLGTGQTVTTSTTANDRFLISCSGYTHIRIIATVYTSGTANILWGSGLVNQVHQVWNTNANALRASVDLRDGAGAAVTIGQKVSASSLPVVVASDQSAIPVTRPTNFQVVLSNQTLTSSGSATVTLDTQELRDIQVITRINGPVTGTFPTLVFTLNDIDHPTNNVLYGTSSPTFTAPTTNNSYLHFTETGKLQLNWTITGTAPSFAGVYVTLVAKEGSTLRDAAGTELGTAANPVQITNPGLPSSLGQKTMALSQPVVIASNQSAVLVQPVPATTGVTAVGAAAAAVTLTLPPVAAQFHYITLLEIMAYSSAGRTGVATPITVTSTNIPGNPAWTFATAGAIGTTDTKLFTFQMPRKSTTVNTATTIVCPATTGVIWRVNVSYYTGA